MIAPLATRRAAVLSTLAGLVLVVTAMTIWRLTYRGIDVEFPPLHAMWDPRFGRLVIPAIAVGLIFWVVLPRLADRLSWGAVLVTSYGGLWIWTMLLGYTEGRNGFARVFERRQEYVYDAQHVKSIGHMLHTFISRVPLDVAHHWHVHVAGHPPGALIFFVLIDRAGITDPFNIGVVVVTLSSTAAVAVLITLRTLGSEAIARRALPWIVLAPSAVWMGVSGDAFYTAVAAWGLALLAIAARHRRVIPGIGAGLLLGLCVYLSYGLVLLGILAAAVLIIARSWRPLPWALAGSGLVVAAFTAAGFSWWKAYPVLRTRYYDGIASMRPFSYWVWADTAAWTFTAGLAVWAAFPSMVAAIRGRTARASTSDAHTDAATDERPDRSGEKVLAQLALAAVLTIVVASVSGMSKAETERIFLPFTIWIVALPALLPRSWHRPLLLSQVVLALCAQQLLLTRW